MKKNIHRRDLIIGFSGMIAGFVALIFWIGISVEKAEDYIYDDLEKISESRKKTNGDVSYDYFASNFEIDADTLNKLVNLILSRKGDNYLFIRYKMVKEDKKFHSFTFTFSSSSSATKYLPIDGISEFPIDTNLKQSQADHYSLAYNRVKKENSIWKNIKGHNHNFDDGVVFPIADVKTFLNLHPAKIYYFYPALAPIVKNGKETKDSFTTIIISNDKNLRQKGAKIRTKDDENFYGDKGQGCCS
jgi:hypothetical protein